MRLLTVPSLAFILAVLNAGSAAEPDCNADGQYPDEENCSKYYVCKDGVASSEDCPFGLYFEQELGDSDACKTCSYAFLS